MGRHAEKSIKRRVVKLPVGSIISVLPSEITLVRYHARGCRKITSRLDLRTGKRLVLLGNYITSGADQAK